MTISFEINDTDDEVPRSKRAGLAIPAELRTAVDDSLANTTTKSVAVTSNDEAAKVRAMLRSLTNREGYEFNVGPKRNSEGTVIAVVFRTLSKKGRNTPTVKRPKNNKTNKYN